jgi:predicted nucleic acid-binding protein
MGIKYLWDTNTAIYYLQRQFSPSAELFMDSILQEYQPSISAITEIELLCWKTASESDLAVLKDFIEDSVVFELEKEIKLKTAELRKTNKIKLPDAIIAATAVVRNLTLLTRNVSDFQNIQDLSVLNPWDK